MKSLDPKGRSLETIVEIILADLDKDFAGNESLKTQARLQRLRCELKKYIVRPKRYSEQVQYLTKMIEEIEAEHPELVTNSLF